MDFRDPGPLECLFAWVARRETQFRKALRLCRPWPQPLALPSHLEWTVRWQLCFGFRDSDTGHQSPHTKPEGEGFGWLEITLHQAPCREARRLACGALGEDREAGEDKDQGSEQSPGPCPLQQGGSDPRQLPLLLGSLCSCKKEAQRDPPGIKTTQD